VKIKIPKLSEINKTFRLKGKGFIDGSTNIIGDLYVTLNPIIPKEINELEEVKIKELKEMPNFN
jgi:DnaJ-class molecular chaperone